MNPDTAKDAKRRLQRVTAAAITEQLDLHAHGQATAKQVLAEAALGMLHGTQRTNVVLVAPTGSGKTLLANSLGKVLERLLGRPIPVVVVDATSLVPAGYRGLSLEERLERHCKPQKDLLAGILVVDEFDKLGAVGDTRFRSHAESSLLTVLNGDPLAVEVRGGPGQPPRALTFDASRWMVVLTGAFSHVRERVHGEAHGVGFSVLAAAEDTAAAPQPTSVTMPITLDHLRQHSGLMAETLGRIQAMAELHPPTLADLEAVARNHPGLRAVALRAKQRKVRLTFGNSFFKAAAEAAMHNHDAGYRSMDGALHRACSSLTNQLLAGTRHAARELTLTRHDYLAMQAGTWCPASPAAPATASAQAEPATPATASPGPAA